MLTFSMDGSRVSWLRTIQLWHIDAVKGGHPPHHCEEPSGPAEGRPKDRLSDEASSRQKSFHHEGREERSLHDLRVFGVIRCFWIASAPELVEGGLAMTKRPTIVT